MTRRRMLRTAAAAATLTLLAGSVAGTGEAAATSSPTTAPTSEPTPTPSPRETAAGTPTGEPTESLPPAPARASLPTLMREDLRGGRIRRERQQYATDAYTRYEVTYPSSDVRVSGILLVPRGTGPFPAVVLNHGYIEPSIYVTGQGLSREQDYLARAGFVVLHTDYRGHASSETRSPRCSRSRGRGTSTPTGSRCSAARWAGASPSTPSSPGRAW